MTFYLSELWQKGPTVVLAVTGILLGALSFVLLLLIHGILSSSQRFCVPKIRQKHTPTHLLVVLGSGGHTAEMLSMLRRLPLDPTLYTFRTYIVTSGDSFSASKAVDFEATLQERYKNSQGKDTGGGNADLSPSYQPDNYSVISVPRARRVHQSFLTAPLSTLQCFWACLQILQGIHPAQRPIPRKTPSPYPDLILTNGPATAVCVVLAAKLLRFLNFVSVMFGVSIKGMSVQQTDTIVYPLRTVFIESWARVTTLSLSGKILLPFADRFLVQWPDLEGRRAWRGMRMSEYVGALVG